MDASRQFLSNEFWILSWGGSVQRALRYRNGAGGTDRSQFRKKIIDYCETELLPEYRSTVTESRHRTNIASLCRYAVAINEQSGVVEHYNIGIAQKLLNLQLKYLWTSGLIVRPTHCPVDRIVLSKTSLRGSCNWTEMETLETYDTVIAAIKEVAGDQHIADWELINFNRRQVAPTSGRNK